MKKNYYSIKVLIISLKNSKRVSVLKKRLKSINIDYKIVEGINGKEIFRKNKQHLIYNKRKTLKNISRELSPQEVGATASHIKAYKYIVKNKIKQAIIMEDDAYPSNYMLEWIKNNVEIENNKILSFYSYPNGFLKKKYYKTVLDKKIFLHNSVTHIFNNSCYQINNYTCKEILKITKGKVIGLGDWPFLICSSKIKLAVTIPFLCVINDNGFSYVRKSQEIFTKKNFLIRKIIHKDIISILRIPYYLSYLPYFLGKYKNKKFYYEHFFYKQFIRIYNYIFNSYYNLETIYYKPKFYWKDLQKKINAIIIN
jgi:GR25 family glycosyltransferase involved in LPS biosynthesis